MSTSCTEHDFYSTFSNFVLSQNLENISTWIELEDQNVKIPSQPSIFIHQFLAKICNLLNSCEAHAFTRTVIQQLVKSYSQKVAMSYRKFLDERGQVQKFSQFFAVQQMFDVKFLKLIFDDDNENYSKYEEWLGEFIDPFDYDVITSTIDSYVQRALDRVSVLYGVINLSAHKGGKATIGQVQDGHNIIPLNNPAGGQLPRIQLLPISIGFVW